MAALRAASLQNHAEAGNAAGVTVEYLLFDAQQTAEKALKGVLAASAEDADLDEALMLARAVVDWAARVIETSPPVE